MTNLEKAVRECGLNTKLQDSSSPSEKQEILDRNTPAILKQLSPDDLIRHTQEVYDATADEYEKNPHTKDVTDELLEFMAMLPDRARVLDVGCGTGKDSFFMSVDNYTFRNSLMGRVREGKATREKFNVPMHKFFGVTGIDNSLCMLRIAREKTAQLIAQGLLTDASTPIFSYEDIHNIDTMTFGGYQAIWSCAALFTHTPYPLLGLAMESAFWVLKPGGLFFTSYTNGIVEGCYNKLLLSSTGRIKYFSQPDPKEIALIAQKLGMTLVSQTFNDFEIKGKVIKPNLFVSQFFRRAP